MDNFIEKVTRQARTLEKSFNLAEWEAAVSGSEEAIRQVRESQAAYMRFWSDPELYQSARDLKEGRPSSDPLVARQLELIQLTAGKNQQDEDTIQRLTEVEGRVRQRYYNYRARVGDRELSDNQIDEALRHSRDSVQVRQVWEASKQVGQQVAEDIRELARLRNSAARAQGYRDHFHRALFLDEIDEQELLDLFDDLEKLSREPFTSLKERMDAALGARFAVPEKELRPWHYGDRFFQEGPQIGELDLDYLFANQNIETLAAATYRGMDMDVGPILSRSDLYPRAGKNQHAFCIHIDREGDIRTLDNLESNHRWAETLLHELGHGVYEQYLAPELPWLLRAPAHTFTTEAVAILMGSLTFDPDWYVQVLAIEEQRARSIAAEALREDRAKKLIFTRWCLTMTNFERQLYHDPESDLDTIWWDCVERYQFLPRPWKRRAPDWAAKIHVALAPVYYHNYQLGHLLAAQLRRQLEDGGIVGRPAAGRWLKQGIFSPGASLAWRGLIEKATGEPLNPRYFVESFTE